MDSTRFHYRPADGWFGDPIPFFWDGVYHVFYDKLQTNGKVCWAHVASRNLVHWEEYPDAIPNGAEGAPDHDACITGGIVERDGVFHAFYSAIGSQGAVICRAHSRDLVSWEKDTGNPILRPDARWYSNRDLTWRDPCVFWNPEASCYWMVFCARTPPDPSQPFTGCLGLATSQDLERWEVKPPVWIPGFSTVVECPDLFPLGDRWVLMHYWHETRLRVAASPSGPWMRPSIEAPDSFGFTSGKTMWDGERRIMIGWVPRHTCDCAPLTWGGTMLLPRELRLLPDGTPATSLPRGVIQALLERDATSGQGARVFTGSSAVCRGSSTDLTVSPSPGHSTLAFWPDAPADLCLQADISFGPGATLGILVRGNADEKAFWPDKTPLDQGYEVFFDPSAGVVELHEFYQWRQRIALKTVRMDFAPSVPFRVELILHGEVLEVFLDRRRSLVHRLIKHPGGVLALLASDGQVEAANLSIGTLT